MNPRSQYLATALSQMGQQPKSAAEGFANLAATAMLRDKLGSATTDPAAPQRSTHWADSPLGMALLGRTPPAGQQPYQFGGVNWGDGAKRLGGLFGLGRAAEAR